MRRRGREHTTVGTQPARGLRQQDSRTSTTERLTGPHAIPTHLPVASVVAMVVDGMTVERIISDLERGTITKCLAFADQAGLGS